MPVLLVVAAVYGIPAKSLRADACLPPPYVVSVNPPDGATNVSIAANIIVQFNQPMVESSVQSELVLTTSTSGSPVILSMITYNSTYNYAVIDPTANLNPNETYYVISGNKIERACDNEYGTKIRTGFVTAAGITNSPPLANDDSHETDVDTLLTVAAPGVLGNDSDVDGSALSAVLNDDVQHGMLTLNPDGSFTYMPTAGYTGPDSFTYYANDLTYNANLATVSIMVSAANTPPVADDDSYGIDEDTLLTVTAPGVLDGDTDTDSDPLTAALVDDVDRGTLALNSDGSFTYAPDNNYHGTDSFTYRAHDSTDDSNLATVDITINPVNDPPEAVSDAYSLDEDIALDVPAPGVTGNDVDPDGLARTAILRRSVEHGGLIFNPDGSFTYYPHPDFNGTDSFIYRLDDGLAISSDALVTLTVLPVADDPVAGDDSYTLDEDYVLAAAAPGIMFNDVDPDGDVLTAALLQEPAHGTLELNPDGSFAYEPEPDFSGNDLFTYQAAVGDRQSEPATVTLNVSPVNDAPVASNDRYSVISGTRLIVAAGGVLDNDSDPDGDALWVRLVSGVSHGRLALSPGGGFTYTPSPGYTGADYFTYRVSDGILSSDIAVVTLWVNLSSGSGGVTPVASPDEYVVNEDDVLSVEPAGLLANDTHPAGARLEAALVEPPSHGALELRSSGSFIYTPDPDYHGPDSFVYRAVDPTGAGAEAAVSIEVVPVSDAPEAADDSYSTAPGVTLQVSAPGVLANDSDVDGDPLSAVLVDGPANGQVTLNSDGSFSYVPSESFSGEDRFTYRVTDGEETSPVVEVLIAVSPEGAGGGNGGQPEVDPELAAAMDFSLTARPVEVVYGDLIDVEMVISNIGEAAFRDLLLLLTLEGEAAISFITASDGQVSLVNQQARIVLPELAPGVVVRAAVEARAISREGGIILFCASGSTGQVIVHQECREVTVNPLPDEQTLPEAEPGETGDPGDGGSDSGDEGRSPADITGPDVPDSQLLQNTTCVHLGKVTLTCVPAVRYLLMGTGAGLIGLAAWLFFRLPASQPGSRGS
nr:tandem-95 repeat protein [Anaerolineae bacterium]